MPIYQYACATCGHQMEALQKMTDAPLTDCPACNKPELRKQLTAAAFRLKGTGWYETDFKNSDNKPGDKPSGKNADNVAGKSGDAKGLAAGSTVKETNTNCQ